MKRALPRLQFHIVIAVILRLVAPVICTFLFAQNSVNAMTFELHRTGGNCSWCSYIYASGQIETDSAGKLEAVIADNRLVGGLLVINSPGGSLEGGIELGKLIRQYDLEVVVGESDIGSPDQYGTRYAVGPSGGICASACVFALAGGSARSKADVTSRIGIHQFYPTGGRFALEAETSSRTQFTVAVLLEYLNLMGVSKELIELASRVPPNEIRWLSIVEMESLNLITLRTRITASIWELTTEFDDLRAFAVQDQFHSRPTFLQYRCGTLVIAFSPANEIELSKTDFSDHLLGASLEVEGQSGEIATDITVVSTHKDLVILQASSVVSQLSSTSGKGVTLKLDMTNWLKSWLGASEFFIPKTNFSDVVRYVDNFCEG